MIFFIRRMGTGGMILPLNGKQSHPPYISAAMKNVTSFLTMTSLMLVSFLGFASTAPGDTITTNIPTIETVTLKKGTVVTLRIEDHISSYDAQVGDLVSLSVYDDVKQGDMVVVKAGVFGQARVTRVRKPGAFGRPGKIELEAVNVKSIDGQSIRLTSMPFAEEGRNNKSAAYAVSIILPAVGVVIGAPYLLPCAVVGLFIKGKEGEVKPMTMLNAVIAKDVQIRP